MFYYDDELFDECLELVESWKPKEFSSELEYHILKG